MKLNKPFSFSENGYQVVEYSAGTNACELGPKALEYAKKNKLLGSEKSKSAPLNKAK